MFNIGAKKNNKLLIKLLLPIFLSIASIILLVASFFYVMVAKGRQTDSSPYYKIPDAQHSDLTTITQKKQWTQHNLSSTIELLAKQEIDQSFIAQTDNLGIIAMPFDTHNKSINDKITFRLKEAGKEEWYYQATYDTNQIQNNIPFPFGFPTIKNSKNILYTFEIKSLHGASDESLSINKTNSYFFIKYKFSKIDLERNPSKLFQFIVAKASEQLQLSTISDIVIILIYFLSPFIVYACVYDIYIRKDVDNV